MDTIQSYRDLRVWQASMDLAAACYEIARRLPREELFGLSAQLRRAAVSVPANIAEGWGRDNTGDYRHALRIAQGSVKEVETHLLLAVRVGMLAENDTHQPLALADDVGRMLRALIRSLDANPRSTR